MNWDEIVLEMSSLVKNKETYQARLGELAFISYEQRGTAAFEDLAKQIEDTVGIKTSPKTLRNKKWVYEKTKDLKIPPDIAYHVLQKIAGMKNPEKWAKMIHEGYSGAEIVRLIRIKKGFKKKTTICGNCGNTVEY